MSKSIFKMNKPASKDISNLMEALKKIPIKSTHFKNLENQFIMAYESDFNDYSMLDQLS